ncbi:MAG: hypothetical protein RIG84_06420 [Roseovarius sp.]
MLKFLNHMASSFEARRAFDADPEGYLARFTDLTDHERKLILARDSTAIDYYMHNRLLNGDDTIVPVHAATTVVVIAVILSPAVAEEVDTESWQSARHHDFWSHVAERGTAYAN